MILFKAQRRAHKGGEVGANGEFYEGGKFIATTDHAKGKPKPNGGGRQEIEPYKWETPPEPGMRSLWRAIGPGVFVGLNRATGKWGLIASDTTWGYYFDHDADLIARAKAHYLNMIARYEAGERWIKPEEAMIKAHVHAYTRHDGTTVRDHEDRRPNRKKRYPEDRASPEAAAALDALKAVRRGSLREALGPKLDSYLVAIHASNEHVRDLVERAGQPAESVAEATLDALAGMDPARLVRLHGWSDLIGFIRSALRDLSVALRQAKMDKAADWLQWQAGEWTDDDLGRLLLRADKRAGTLSKGHSMDTLNRLLGDFGQQPVAVLFLKSYVKPTSYVRNGKTVQRRGYTDKRSKKLEGGGKDPYTGDLFGQSEPVPEPETAKLSAHRKAERDTIEKHGTTAGPDAENTYKTRYLMHLHGGAGSGGHTDSAHAEGDNWVMPIQDAIAEHKELVHAAETPSKADDKEELKEQKGELKRMEAADTDDDHPAPIPRRTIAGLPDSDRTKWIGHHRAHHELTYYEMPQIKKRMEKVRHLKNQAESEMRQQEAHDKDLRGSGLPGSIERADQHKDAADRMRIERKGHADELGRLADVHAQIYEMAGKHARAKHSILPESDDLRMDFMSGKRRDDREEAKYAADALKQYRAFYKKKTMAKSILFLKTHVSGYTRADGVTVKPHEDKRAKKITPPKGWVHAQGDDQFNPWGAHPYRHVFSRDYGGDGKPVHNLSILRHTDGDYIPAHGGVVMHDKKTKTPDDAARIAEDWLRGSHPDVVEKRDWRDEENWHTRTMGRMKTLSDDALRFIVKDANEAAANIEEMNPNSEKAGRYRDEAHYAAMELRRRQDGSK